MFLKGVLVLSTAALLTVGAYWQPVDSTDKKATKMRNSIEEHARKAKDNQEQSIRLLADALFQDVAAALPGSLSTRMKDRLIEAEVKYRQGHKGIRESHIVRAVNQLATRFSAPDYAQTSPLQIRTLRLELMKQYPNFIAQDEDDKKALKKKVGDRINQDVSPLEAFFLAAVMVEQKMLNEDWQEGPDEWAANAKAHKKHFNQDHPGSAKIIGMPPNVAKRREMAEVVSRSVSSLTITDAQQLANELLDTLGVKKVGK